MVQNNRPTGLTRKEVVDYYTDPKNCDKKGGCLISKKSVVDAYDKDNYALIKWDGKTRRLARLILKEKVGDKKMEGKLTLHSCDNPPCIKPSHLSPGTPKENAENNSDIKLKEMANKKTFRWNGPIDNYFGITSENAEEVFSFLEEDDNNEAYITITSPGGLFSTAQTIIERLSPYKNKIKTEINGMVASAGSHIAMSVGEKTYARGQSELMIHRASLGLDGNAEDFEKAKERLDQVDSILIQSIKEKSGLSEEKIREYMENETTFTSKRALKEGLIDEILPPNKKFTEAMIDEAIKAYKEVSDTRKVNLNIESNKEILMPEEKNKDVNQEEEVKDEKTQEIEVKTSETQVFDKSITEVIASKEKKILTLETELFIVKGENEKLEKAVKEYKEKDKRRDALDNAKAIEEAVTRGALSPSQEQAYVENFKKAEGNEEATNLLRGFLKDLPSSEYFKVKGKAFSKDDLNYYPQEEVERLMKQPNITKDEAIQILQRRHENKEIN